MDDNEALNYIREHLSVAACYEAIAEEASEVAQAASKCARILRGENPTPKHIDEARPELENELSDLKLACDLVDISARPEEYTYKLERMKNRIEEAHLVRPTSVTYETVNLDQLDDEGKRLYESAQKGIFEPEPDTTPVMDVDGETLYEYRDIYPNEYEKQKAEQFWRNYEDHMGQA